MERIDTPGRSYDDVFCQKCDWSGSTPQDSCPACGVSGELKSLGAGLNTIEGTSGMRE